MNVSPEIAAIKEHLLNHIRKQPGPLGDDCWIWTLSLSEGYGQVSWNGFDGRAHRWSYQVFVGPIPDNLQVQHKCDRKDCLNPDHLKLGDHASNSADVWSRGEPELTSQEFERLCSELADLDREAASLEVRRKEIEAQLRRTIADRRNDRGPGFEEHRSVKRLARKAAAEERERIVAEHRAKMSPEAQAKLKARIAELKEREQRNGRRSVGKFDDRSMIGD